MGGAPERLREEGVRDQAAESRQQTGRAAFPFPIWDSAPNPLLRQTKVSPVREQARGRGHSSRVTLSVTYSCRAALARARPAAAPTPRATATPAPGPADSARPPRARSGPARPARPARPHGLGGWGLAGAGPRSPTCTAKRHWEARAPTPGRACARGSGSSPGRG